MIVLTQIDSSEVDTTLKNSKDLKRWCTTICEPGFRQRGGEKNLFSTVWLPICLYVVVSHSHTDSKVSPMFSHRIPGYSHGVKARTSEKVKLFHHCNMCKVYNDIYYFQKVVRLSVIAHNRRPPCQVKIVIFRECRSKEQRKSGNENEKRGSSDILGGFSFETRICFRMTDFNVTSSQLILIARKFIELWWSRIFWRHNWLWNLWFTYLSQLEWKLSQYWLL